MKLKQSNKIIIIGVWMFSTSAFSDIDKLSVSPDFGFSGSQFNFTVTLSKPLPKDDKVQIDFGNGNLHHTTSDCGNYSLHNMKDGASYMFIIKGTNSSTCAFNGFSDAGSTALTVRLPPGHGATTAGKHTIYNFIVSGNDVYVSWIPGY
jgi:hypothetical protein